MQVVGSEVNLMSSKVRAIYAPDECYAAWRSAAAAEGRSLSNWLVRAANRAAIAAGYDPAPALTARNARELHMTLGQAFEWQQRELVSRAAEPKPLQQWPADD